MHTINQVLGGWQIQKNGDPVKFFPLQPFEIHSDSQAYLEAIEYVREADSYGTYFDFTAITIKSSKVGMF